MGRRSNWGAMVNAAIWGDPSQSDDEDTADSKPPLRKRITAAKRKTGILVGLREAALLLNLPTEGATWRRRVARRLQALERETGLSIYAASRGPTGARVRIDALRRVSPVAFMGAELAAQFEARLLALESRLSAAERMIHSVQTKARHAKRRQ